MHANEPAMEIQVALLLQGPLHPETKIVHYADVRKGIIELVLFSLAVIAAFQSSFLELYMYCRG